MGKSEKHEEFCMTRARTTGSLLHTDVGSHDMARSRAFRWGEDGIAGVSDTHGLQNIAFAFWNEKELVPQLHSMSSLTGLVNF